jgi:regulator of sigma E protease
MIRSYLYAIVFNLGILIFIHELGHFVASRLSGVTVERFSMGFGPRILKFTRGATEYALSVIPFGG